MFYKQAARPRVRPSRLASSPLVDAIAMRLDDGPHDDEEGTVVVPRWVTRRRLAPVARRPRGRRVLHACGLLGVFLQVTIDMGRPDEGSPSSGDAGTVSGMPSDPHTRG